MYMIVGIGLPRTGTRSLAKALDILGYRGSHHCELIGQTIGSSHGDTYIIDNSVYSHLDQLINEEDVFIMTVRDYEDWKRSVAKFDYTGPDLLKYKSLCLEAFEKRGIRLLVFDIKDGWEPLCNFLMRSVPDQEFPSIA